MSLLRYALVLIMIAHSCDYSIVIVLSYLKMNHRDSAPHTPRVILLGPTGCGKSVQAELLASKYGLVNGKTIHITLPSRYFRISINSFFQKVAAFRGGVGVCGTVGKVATFG